MWSAPSSQAQLHTDYNPHLDEPAPLLPLPIINLPVLNGDFLPGLPTVPVYPPFAPLPTVGSNAEKSKYIDGTVNITPERSTIIDDNTAKASYVISYGEFLSDVNIYTGQKQSANGLDVWIPKEARNVKFTLIGITDVIRTVMINSDIELGTYTEVELPPEYKPIDLNVPLEYCEEANCLAQKDNEKVAVDWFTSNGAQIPTVNQINREGFNNVLVRKISSTERYGVEMNPNHDLYVLAPANVKNGVTAVRVEYEIDRQEEDIFPAIRALTGVSCSNTDRVIRDNPLLSDETNWCDSLYTYNNRHARLPATSEIARGDFDVNGLHLASDSCSVTRNMSSWYKIGPDVASSKFKYGQTFNLHLNPTLKYRGITDVEDMCDQASVTIPKITKKADKNILTTERDVFEKLFIKNDEAHSGTTATGEVLLNDYFVTVSGSLDNEKIAEILKNPENHKTYSDIEKFEIKYSLNDNVIATSTGVVTIDTSIFTESGIYKVGSYKICEK